MNSAARLFKPRRSSLNYDVERRKAAALCVRCPRSRHTPDLSALVAIRWDVELVQACVDMHVHLRDDVLMRTTIELSDEHRARLLELAARRGEKGFSSIVEEALERYFVREERRREAVDRALAALGSLTPEEADRLEEEVSRLRRSWR